ncbi:hypothetical protein pb186bvf_014620 [Paramecium bursaria]
MEQELLEWISQVEPTQSIDDLKSGVALCYIVNKEIYQEKRLCELKIRVINCQKTEYQNCIRNLQYGLQMIEESGNQQFKHLTGQMLYANPLKCYQIISHFYQNSQKPKISSKPPKAPKQDELFYVEENSITHISQQQEEPVANKYKVIRPHSPYQKNDSFFQNQQSIQTHTQSLEKPEIEHPRTLTHNTDYLEQSNRSSEKRQTPQKQELSFSKPKPDQYNEKLKMLENEIKSLDTKIQREQNEIVNLKRQSVSKSVDNQQVVLISEDQRIMLVEWLKDIRLIKANASQLQDKLAKICKNGVIFFDLINRLSGREEALKGAIRNPKNQGQIKQNYRRVLEFLKQFEKMNFRYLNSEQQLSEGDEECFWGLLLDIKQFYHNFNPSDLSKTQDNIKTTKITKQVLETRQSIEKPEPIIQKEPSSRNINSPGTYTHLHSQKQEFDSVNKSNNSLMKKSQMNSAQGTPVHQSLSQSRHFSSSKQKRPKSNSVSRNCVTREMELYVQTYFKQKGLYHNDNLFNDPIRNGNYIFTILDQPHTQQNFKSILDVERNLHEGLQSIRALVDTGAIPVWIKAVTQENIMQLDKQAMGLYWWLLKHQVQKPELKEQISQYILPYKQEDIDQLKLVTLYWARETIPHQNIQSFSDLIMMCQTGVLICQLVSEVMGAKFSPIHSNPIGEKQCLANIRKALDNLRGKQLGQRFLWKERQIYEGDQLVIIGLFEDVRRFQDGLPGRQGEDYFHEGPYFKCNKQLAGNAKISTEIFQCKPLSLLDQNQVQISKRLVFDDPQPQQPQKQQPSHDWLSQFGFKINWNKQTLDEFKDGTILLLLIQKFENLEFKGVQWKPQTNAAQLNNIRKVFNILKDKVDMPLDLVLDQDKVASGDKDFILKVLSSIKNIYRSKIRKS